MCTHSKVLDRISALHGGIVRKGGKSAFRLEARDNYCQGAYSSAVREPALQKRGGKAWKMQRYKPRKKWAQLSPIFNYKQTWTNHFITRRQLKLDSPSPWPWPKILVILNLREGKSERGGRVMYFVQCACLIVTSNGLEAGCASWTPIVAGVWLFSTVHVSM